MLETNRPGVKACTRSNVLATENKNVGDGLSEGDVYTLVLVLSRVVSGLFVHDDLIRSSCWRGTDEWQKLTPEHLYFTHNWKQKYGDRSFQDYSYP
jgi:hypothetical protein